MARKCPGEREKVAEEVVVLHAGSSAVTTGEAGHHLADHALRMARQRVKEMEVADLLVSDIAEESSVLRITLAIARVTSRLSPRYIL